MLLSVLAGCAGNAAPKAEDLNVLLIVVDTLGAEHMGAYGGDARTPNLDALAAGGVRFGSAFSSAPWTQPSIASLMTSLMPSQHGVQRLGQALPAAFETLAEQLGGQLGRQTQGVVSHVLLLPKNGYAQGFDQYDSRAAGGHDELSSEQVTAGAIEFLDAREASKANAKPFFLFVHYFDPHYLYREHPEFPHGAPYDGPITSSMPIWELRDQRQTLNARDIEHLKDLYHEEIAFTDYHIGRLLEHLRVKGLEQNTLVIFTADHGEEFMGHGWIGHTRTLYDELLHVPLIFSLPGVLDAALVRSPVSLLDVAPTVLDLLGSAAPAAWQGRSLVPLLSGAATSEPARLVFSEVSYGPKGESKKKQAMEKRAHKTSLVLGELKMIHDRLSGRWELYRRAEDPGEQRDLYSESDRAQGVLKSKILEFEASRGQSELGAVKLDAGEMDQLEKLGYLRSHDEED